MPYNVEKQIQVAMERGDFKKLPGKGKRQQLEENPFVSSETRIVNQMLEDNGFAPNWIEVDREIRSERAQSRSVLENLKRRRQQLQAAIRIQPFSRDKAHRVFELERDRALQTYTSQLKGLNQKIFRYNLTVPGRDRQMPLYNIDESIAEFQEECPSL